MEDLFALEEWRRHSPVVPEGRWYKDFGTFRLCGQGSYRSPPPKGSGAW